MSYVRDDLWVTSHQLICMLGLAQVSRQMQPGRMVRAAMIIHILSQSNREHASPLFVPSLISCHQSQHTPYSDMNTHTEESCPTHLPSYPMLVDCYPCSAGDHGSRAQQLARPLRPFRLTICQLPRCWESDHCMSRSHQGTMRLSNRHLDLVDLGLSQVHSTPAQKFSSKLRVDGHICPGRVSTRPPTTNTSTVFHPLVLIRFKSDPKASLLPSTTGANVRWQ